MTKTYEGFPTRAQWNVSLWLNNDEPSYRLMQEAIRRTRNRDEAASFVLASLPASTPDGFRYSLTAIKRAMVGLGRG